MTLSDPELLSEIFNDTKHARPVYDSWASWLSSNVIVD